MSDLVKRVGSDSVLGAGDAQKVKDFVYLDETAVAPSPSRDYFHIVVTTSTVTLTQWRISHGPRTVPIETSTMLHGWNRDHNLVADVTRVFGQFMVDYINGLCEGLVDWIMVLPDKLFVKIFTYIGIKELHTISPVCKRFKKVCSSNELWECFFRTYRGQLPIEYDAKAHAIQMSWKSLFFIKRLQDNVFTGKTMVFGHRPDNEFRQFANQLRMPEEKRPWALHSKKTKNVGRMQSKPKPNVFPTPRSAASASTFATFVPKSSKPLESHGKIGTTAVAEKWNDDDFPDSESQNRQENGETDAVPKKTILPPKPKAKAPRPPSPPTTRGFTLPDRKWNVYKK